MSQSLKARKEISTWDRLILAGEILYGRHGLEGVSLRQICAAAGSGDNYAVQYHFGNADGLVKAILAKRRPEMEMQRAQLLLQMKRGSTLTTRDLLGCLFRPVLEHRDEQGKRVHASFELALLCSPRGAAFHDDALQEMSITQELLELLHIANPHLTAAFIWYRLQLIATLVFSSVCARFSPYESTSFDDAVIENALDMAVGALNASQGDAAADMMRRVGTRRINQTDST